jgi:hypothetical protein
MRKPVTFTLLLLLITSYSYAQWQQTNGPLGGTVNCLLYKDSKIFAGTQSKGIYYSTNNGQSWIQTVGNYKQVNNIVSNSSYIFAARDGGIHRSSNNGVNWITILPVSYVMSDVSADGSNIYAGGADGIYVSSNSGDNWFYPLPDLAIYSVTALGGEAYTSGRTVVQPYTNKAFRSLDSGHNWTELTSISSIYSALISDSIVFVGSLTGVLFSTDKGMTWQQTSLYNQAVISLLQKDNYLFAGTSGNGIYVSSDNGQNWVQSSLSNKTIHSIVSSGSDLFAASSLHGIYKSSDMGFSWAPNNFSSHTISSVQFNGNAIFAGSRSNTLDKDTSNGVYISTNMGDSWVQTLKNEYINSIEVNNTDAFTGTYFGGCLYFSSNNGNNWQVNSLNRSTYGIKVFNQNIVVSAYEGLFKIFRSTNYGLNWNLVSFDLKVPSFLVKDKIMFAATLWDVYKSTDSGLAWYKTNLNTTSNEALASSGPYILAGAYNGVYRSTNYGLNWSSTLLNQIVNCLTSQGANVFAGTSNGLYVSTDYGYNWVQKNEGLGNIKVISLGLVNGFLFAGTVDNSVWKRALSEIISVNVISTIVPDNFSLSQNYPNPFNPETKIKFDVPKASFTKLIIYDLLGREVTTLVNEELKPGTYGVDWDASAFSSGVYFYKIISGDYSETKKMVLIK